MKQSFNRYRVLRFGTKLLLRCIDRLVAGSLRQRHNNKRLLLGKFRNLFLILSSKDYVAYTKHYKVFSKSDLKQIIQNEKTLLSPHKESYVITRIQAVNESNWRVTFFFIDTQKYPFVANYLFLIPIHDLVNWWFETHPVMQEQLALVRFGAFGSFTYVTELSSSAIAINEDGTGRHPLIPQADFKHDIRNGTSVLFAYLASMSIFRLNGVINVAPMRAVDILNIDYLMSGAKAMALALVAGFLLQAAFIQSEYLYLNHAVTSTESLREEVIVERQRYGNQVAELENYYSALGSKSKVAEYFSVITDLPEELDTLVTGLQYQDGVVTVRGETTDVEALLGLLTATAAFSDGQYDSPLRKAANGKVVFTLRMSVVND